MTDIFELIRQMCPDGVAVTTVSEIGALYGGLSGKGRDDFKNGNAHFASYMNVYANMELDLTVGDKVVVNADENQKMLQRGDIIFTGSSETPDECGFSSVVMEEPAEPWYLNSFCFFLRLNDVDLLLPGFSKYLFRSENLRKQIIATANGITRFNVSKAKFLKIRIPLPPLQIQREIVAILDKFDSYCNSMTAGLAGELEMRRKQYRYWAEHLVMDGNVEMVELGKLCRINKGTQMNKSDYQDGPYPIYNMGAEPSGTHTEYNRDIPSIVIAGHGNSCGFVNWVDEPFWAGGGCYYLDSLAPDLSNRYLYHAMKVREGFLMGLGSHGPIRHLYPRTIARLQVPVPVSVPGTGAWDIARQQSICDTLDKFLTLEHELEHELELRRKQYEYYRDMLLSFPERKENA